MTSIDVFRRFDEAAAKEGKRPAPQNFTESIRRLSALIDMLPQRPVIEDKHAERWLNRTIEMAIQRMELEMGEGKATVADVHNHVLWHVRRASAIGGSEIGEVVLHFRGEKGNFSNARNLVLEKLLIMAPMPGDEAMSRGVIAEPYIQMMYLKDVEGISDEASLDLLKGYRWEGAPQIVGTPDDIVIYPQNFRKIIDYKCPSAAVNEEYEKKGGVSFGYVCQVHQYGILSKHAGVDYVGMDVCCFDPRTFKIVPYKIDYDPELEQEMLESSAILWNDYVMKGVVPEVPGIGELEVEDEEFRDLVMQATAMKMIADEVNTRRLELLSRISAIGNEEHDLKDGKIDLGFASFTRKRSWDEETLVDLAEARGVDVDAYMKPQKKIDADEAAAMLKEIFDASKESPRALVQLVSDMVEGGIPVEKKLDTKALTEHLETLDVDLTNAAGISESFRVSTSKKQLPKVEFVRHEAYELVDQIEEVVESESARMLNFQPGHSPDDDPDMMMM